MAPRVLRELSWCSSKLREVAKVLSAMSVRLTVPPVEVKMTASRADEGITRGMRLPRELTGESPVQLSLEDFDEVCKTSLPGSEAGSESL